MSWEITKYEAVCQDCGRKGVCIKGSNDWGRFLCTWEGFDNLNPPPVLVLRGKLSRDHMLPKCACGSMDIEVGDVIEMPLTNGSIPILQRVPARKKNLTGRKTSTVGQGRTGRHRRKPQTR
jgi:hypothetical protein